jgi:hypothetical protein
MKQCCFAAWWRLLQFFSPIADELTHIVLGSLEFVDLVSEREQLFFREGKHPTARHSTVVECSQNF